MQEFLSQVSEGTEVLLVLSIILFAGFIMTRLTNTLNLPKVSGYILAGILIGPCGLNFIPQYMISHMGFVSDLALAFIAFGVGKFFKKEVLLRTGKKIIIITVFEAMMAGILVTLATKFFFALDWDFALILGAIATATAPASTMMTINQYKAKGEFVDTLLQIVALDDVVCLLAFSVVSALASGHAAGNVEVSDIVMPVVYNLLALLLGFFCGYFLSRLLIPTRSKDNRLILAIAMLLGISGICAAADISPLLSCMVFGAAYINLTRDKKLYRQINNFTPPVMSIFFIVSGMNLDVKALTTVGAIGVTYFFIRIVGKYLGTYVSCAITGTSREIRNFMGLALIPQAGVAIGLAFLGQRLLPPETGNLMLTIILSSSVLYEMVGPVSAKAALFLSGSIQLGKNDGKSLECPAEEPGGCCGGYEDENEGTKTAVFRSTGTKERLETAAALSSSGRGRVYGAEMNMEDTDDFVSLYEEEDEDSAAGAGDNRDRDECLEEEGYLSRDGCAEADEDPDGDGSFDGDDSTDENWNQDDDVNQDDDENQDDGASRDVDGCRSGSGRRKGSKSTKELLDEINEMSAGVDEMEDFDIEREVSPEKPKKNGKNKKRHKKK